MIAFLILNYAYVWISNLLWPLQEGYSHYPESQSLGQLIMWSPWAALGHTLWGKKKLYVFLFRNFFSAPKSCMQILVGWKAKEQMGTCISLVYQKVMIQYVSWRDTFTDCLNAWILWSKSSALCSIPKTNTNIIISF